MQGTVSYEGFGWGFIQHDNPTLSDIFYHHTGLIGRRRLLKGERVEFEVSERNGKPIAVQVRVISPDPASNGGSHERS